MAPAFAVKIRLFRPVTPASSAFPFCTCGEKRLLKPTMTMGARPDRAASSAACST